VFLCLFFAAIAFGLATFYLLKISQERRFEAAFKSIARETAELAEANAEGVFGQLKSLATAITSVAQSSETRFPFVTVPHFDLRTQEIASLTGVEMILFVPFVSGDDRDAFEHYQVANQQWILEDYVSIT